MDLVQNLFNEFPELTNEDFDVDKGSILIQDDSDGLGAYIAKWEYIKPIPKGLKLGK